MPYKILIILTNPFDPNAGGVERSTFKISGYLKNKGYSTHVFSFSKNEHATQDTAILHTAKFSGREKEYANHIELKNLIKQIKPDIVINQMPYALEIGKSLCEIQKKQDFLLLSCLRNTLYTVRNNIDDYLEALAPAYLNSIFKNELGRKLFLWLHKLKHSRDLKSILNSYDYFIMFAQPNIEELKYFVGNYKLNKTHLIPNSILNVLPKVPKKEKRILWLGRLDNKQKRADLILPFWTKVMKVLPDWQLDIVGDGNAFEQIENKIKEENIPRVYMYGKQTPYQYYKRATIYIMTSSFEGFPNTLIEAQSYACIPVVYDTYPMCSWVLKEGKTGFLIPPFDINKMASRIIEIAKNQKLQQINMKLSLENAREFEINTVGELWLDFFEKNIHRQEEIKKKLG